MSASSSRSEIGLAVPDLKLHWEPCTAITGPAISCGATPASLYYRTCGVASHGASVWLCPVHALLAPYGGICRECARRGGVVHVRVVRIVIEPVRLPAALRRPLPVPAAAVPGSCPDPGSGRLIVSQGQPRKEA